jgi:hypothetical protein
MIVFNEDKHALNEAALDIPKILTAEVKYWDSIPLKTKEDFIAAYGDLEDNNDHTGCAYIIAKFAKNKKVMQIVLYIAAIHHTEGSMPYELDRYRYDITDPLYTAIVK